MDTFSLSRTKPRFNLLTRAFIYVISLPLKMLFLGVSVNRLFRAAADLLGERKRRAGGRGVLRRLQELPGPAVHSRRVRHLFQNLPEGIPDGGHHHRLLHVRNRNYASSRWKYVFFSEHKEQPAESQRSWQDTDALPVRLAGECDHLLLQLSYFIYIYIYTIWSLSPFVHMSSTLLQC